MNVLTYEVLTENRQGKEINWKVFSSFLQAEKYYNSIHAVQGHTYKFIKYLNNQQKVIRSK